MPAASRKRLPPPKAMYLIEDELPDMLTAAMAAQYVGVSEQSVRNWTKLAKNPLPCLRMGGSIRFRKTAFLDWLRQQETGGVC